MDSIEVIGMDSEVIRKVDLMSKSIIQEHTDPASRECFLCREAAGPIPELKHTGLHKHHFLHGPDRKKAEHFGLWAYVCSERHHEYGPEAPHVNKAVDLHLQQVAQTEFEKRYSHEEWMKQFGRNYL